MRVYHQDWRATHLLQMARNIDRRRGWFAERPTPLQLANLAVAAAQFAGRAERMLALPVVLKVDVSPLCNLRCTYCVHAVPGPGSDPALAEQAFRRDDLMAVADFERVMSQVAGRTMGVSLYYLGDPLMHPRLDELCAVARDARLTSHISSNYSFKLSDERRTRLVASGLTHLTVCVDGLHQPDYARTRVGGHIDVVLDNLERTLRIRHALGRRHPKVEVQFLRFRHNLGDVDDVVAWCRDRGVDQFTDYWGNLHNYTNELPGRYRVHGPKRDRGLPHCTWPHFAMQVKYDGDVIPCCYFRHGDQYRPGGDTRAVGNVLRTSVREVWNSPAYRALRRLVSRPSRSLVEPALAEAFCTGCPTVFVTDMEDRRRIAEEHAWEELYVHDARGIVRRRATAGGGAG